MKPITVWCLLALMLPAMPASAQEWSLSQAQGTAGLAVVQGTGNVVFISLFCDGGTPYLSVGMNPPAARAFPFALTVAGQTVSLPLTAGGRDGRLWLSDVSESRLPALLAQSAGSMQVRIGDQRHGEISLANAAGTVRQALGGCYQGFDARLADGVDAAGMAMTYTLVMTEDQFVAECQRGYPESYPVAESQRWCRQGWEQALAAQPAATMLLDMAAQRFAGPIALDRAKALLPQVRDFVTKRHQYAALAEGSLDKLGVHLKGESDVRELSLSWSGTGNDGWPYDIEKALELRGATLTEIACRSYDWPQSAKLVRVDLPDRPRFHITVGQTAAGLGTQFQSYSVSMDITGAALAFESDMTQECR